jgi:hypothetical protein
MRCPTKSPLLPGIVGPKAPDGSFQILARVASPTVAPPSLHRFHDAYFNTGLITPPFYGAASVSPRWIG